MIDIHHLYDTDYSEWARRNAELLRSGDFSALDIEHLRFSGGRVGSG